MWDIKDCRIEKRNYFLTEYCTFVFVPSSTSKQQLKIRHINYVPALDVHSVFARVIAFLSVVSSNGRWVFASRRYHSEQQRSGRLVNSNPPIKRAKLHSIYGPLARNLWPSRNFWVIGSVTSYGVIAQPISRFARKSALGFAAFRARKARNSLVRWNNFPGEWFIDSRGMERRQTWDKEGENWMRKLKVRAPRIETNDFLVRGVIIFQ